MMSVQALTDVVSIITSEGMKILACLVVLVVGMKLIKSISKRIRRMKALDQIDTNLLSFIESGISIALYAVLVIICCGVLGIDTASLIAVLASAGVAIGLAMQGALSNVAGGFLILFLHPFHVGDYVDAGGASGTVKSINMFYTEIVTVDNKTITVPNGNLTGAVITNYSTNGNRRVDLDFKVGFTMDTELVKGILVKTAQKHPLVLKNEDIFARISAQDTGAFVYTLRVWCKTEDYWTVYFDMIEQTKAAFEENNIVIPYAKTDVHMI